MNIDKILDAIRQLGKYICICTVIIAVGHGLIYRQFWAPCYVSVVCWIGILIWVIGASGMWTENERRLVPPTKPAPISPSNRRGCFGRSLHALDVFRKARSPSAFGCLWHRFSISKRS